MKHWQQWKLHHLETILESAKKFVMHTSVLGAHQTVKLPGKLLACAHALRWNQQ
jgi:hypothetical protein